MADKKISELDPITGATVAADDVFVVVDTSGGVTRKITHDELKIALALGDTPQFNQINMADDAKILLGNSDDLQLYHESSTGNSYIADKGTGELRLEASNLIRMMGNNGETIAVFNEDGAVSLRYDGSSKISTSATGIDVTGTATMDGLTVDGGTSDLRLDSTEVYSSTAVSTSQLTVKNFDSTTAYTPSVLSFQARGSTTTSSSWQLGNAGLDTAYSQSDFFIKNRIGSSAYRQRLLIEGTGDISFYEDTGTTAKFFWDASAESLGIGTDSPLGLLNLEASSGNSQLYITTNDTTSRAQLIFGDSADSNVGGVQYDHSDDSMQFHSGNGGERMRISSSGDVGIGGNGTGNGLGVYLNKGAVANFYEASDGTKTMITGTDASNDYVKIGSLSAHPVGFVVGNGEKMRIDASGNVGIGTDSPATKISVQNDSDTDYDPSTAAFNSIATLKNNTSGALNNALLLFTTESNGEWYIGGVQNSGNNAADFVFASRASGARAERMRVDSVGNLLVGTDSLAVSISTGSVTGTVINSSGLFEAAKTGTVMELNRLTDDGKILNFRKDGSNVGYIGATDGKLFIGTQDGSDAFLRFQSNQISPCAHEGSFRDNAIDLGNIAARFDDIFATNGTIQTSDRNEKQDIAELSDAEQRVAVAAKGLLRKFRWKDAVNEKGDEARTHFGIIAQDLQDAFTAEGLDAGRYAMFTSNRWWETQTEVAAVEAVEATEDTEAIEAVDAYTRTDTYDTAEEAPEGATERTRLGIRYSELLAFIISAI